MTYPSKIDNVLQRIHEIIFEGAGTSPYTITSASLTGKYYQDGRDESSLAQDVLTKPVVNINFPSFTDTQIFPKPNTKIMYNMRFKIDVGYKLDSALLESRRAEMENSASNAAIQIQKCLTHPGQLNYTSNFEPTGLSNGCLIFNGMGNYKKNYKLNLQTLTLDFEGIVVLSNENPEIPDQGNLVAWFEATPSDVVFSGSSTSVVSQLTDKSGNNRHFINSGSNSICPTFAFDQTLKHGALAFTGNESMYMSSSTQMPGGLLSGSMCIVYRTTLANNGFLISQDHNNQQAVYAADARAYSISNQNAGFFDIVNFTNEPNINRGNYFVFDTFSAATTVPKIYGGTGGEISTTTSINDAQNFAYPDGGLILGGDDSQNKLRGYVAEILIYKGILSTANRDTLFKYLNLKYPGLQ